MSTYDFCPDPDDFGPEPAHIANPSKPRPITELQAKNLAYRLCARYQHGMGVYEFDSTTLLDLVRAVERHHKLIPQQNYVTLA